MMQEKRGKREASGSLSSTVLAKLSAPSQLAEYITSITSARGAQRGGRLKKKECSTDISEEQSGRGEGRTGKQRPAPRKTPRRKPNAGVWKPNGDGSVRLVERKVGSFSATRENHMTDLAVPEVLMSSRSGRKDKVTIPEPRATRENMFSHPKTDHKDARDNRLDSDNESLEPHLVAAVGLMSGMNPRFMGTDPSPPLPPPPPPKPYYENPGIDLDRWGGARRTDHGSYPAPSAPPDDPLPWKPLRTKHNQVETVPPARPTPANFSRPAEAPRSRSVVREPSLPPRPQLRHENRKISGVTAPSTLSRKPVAASGSPKKNVATSGSSKSSKTPSKKAAPTTRSSNSPKKTASNPPTSMKQPPLTGSRYHIKALQAGRRLSQTSSRGPPIPTSDVNGISPLSSRVSNDSSVSPMSSHPLRSVGSTMGELNREIDDVMDCFSEPDEDPMARRWH
ncbi:hypothetical protein F5882DRAFT_525396 [Hyaloscypha sp. PMI_1271]|nr:hypothetical protein F5882DRAFT_525396 [Hyaloscypha sp. PMI_1271]